jgi:hypothetical protein
MLMHKNYLAVMCASYMNEDGKVHPLYLRGGLLDESMLEALKARGLDVDLPQTINKWNSLLPRDPPETNDRALLRQYYQRLREADVALLGEIENKVGRTEDARETIWKVFGDAVRQRLIVANLHSYRTPQELMMDFASNSASGCGPKEQPLKRRCSNNGRLSSNIWSKKFSLKIRTCATR